MAGSKGRKVRKKRDSRIKAWEDMSGANQINPRVKMVAGYAYKKPGSLNARK